MARAYRIYTVATMEGVQLAAFTVKRELATWLRPKRALHTLIVRAFYDGHPDRDYTILQHKDIFGDD